MNNKSTKSNAAIAEISLDKLKIHPKNVRQSYEGIEELTASIKENGILQNLTVVPDPGDEGMYFVVIGNRRLTAAREAGIASAPCRIADMEETEQVMSMLAENMNRQNLKIHEEAAGIQMCLDDYGFTVEDVAQKTGLSETTVRHRANIAKLDRKALREKAKDSRDLAWKAQSAADDEKRTKATKKLTALAKKEGIEPAPEGTSNELYGNKWETAAEYDLTGDIPKKLFDGDRKGLFYIIQYRSFKIIRKAKKVKRELTESEVREKEIAKRKRQIKAMYKEMHAQMGDFVRSVIDGKTEELKEMEELTQGLWDVLISKNAWISRNYMMCALLGRDSGDAPEVERKAAREKISGLMLHQQMLVIAYWVCRDVELADYKGRYAENNAETLKKLYSCLALYGFSFGEEEYVSLMEGSHPLYVVKEEPQEKEPEDDAADDESSAKEEEILTTAEHSTEGEADSRIEEVQEELQKFAG